MGFASIRPSSLLLILAIAILVFGTDRLKHLGRDLAAAIREFREGMAEPTDKNKDKDKPQ